MQSGDDVSVGSTFTSVRFGFEFRTFENHRRICRREVGVSMVDRFGRLSLFFEDLFTFLPIQMTHYTLHITPRGVCNFFPASHYTLQITDYTLHPVPKSA